MIDTLTGETVELFADIGLGGEQQRFLGQPVLGNADIGGIEIGDLEAQAFEDGISAAAGMEFGGLGEGGDLVDPVGEDGRQPLAFVAAGSDQVLERGFGGREDGAVEGLLGFGAERALVLFEDAAKAENAVQ